MFFFEDQQQFKQQLWLNFRLFINFWKVSVVSYGQKFEENPKIQIRLSPVELYKSSIRDSAEHNLNSRYFTESCKIMYTNTSKFYLATLI